MALRSLHQSYEIPVARLCGNRHEGFRENGAPSLEQWDVRKYMPEHNPQLRGSSALANNTDN